MADSAGTLEPETDSADIPESGAETVDCAVDSCGSFASAVGQTAWEACFLASS